MTLISTQAFLEILGRKSPEWTDAEIAAYVRECAPHVWECMTAEQRSANTDERMKAAQEWAAQYTPEELRQMEEQYHKECTDPSPFFSFFTRVNEPAS